MSYIAGWDLGLKGDLSGFILLDVTPAIKAVPPQNYQPAVKAEPAVYTVRSIIRWPVTPEMKYSTQVADVASWLKPKGEKQRAKLIIDLTGVGIGVGEMITAAGLDFVGVTIIGQGETHQVEGGWHVLKTDLMTAVEIVSENHQLKIAPELELAGLLTNEMEGFRRNRTKTGGVKLEAGNDWRTAKHDDLVLGTALAVWAATQYKGWARASIGNWGGWMPTR